VEFWLYNGRIGKSNIFKIYKKTTLFKGADNIDQLIKITELLGTDDLYKYMETYGLTFPSGVQE